MIIKPFCFYGRSRVFRHGKTGYAIHVGKGRDYLGFKYGDDLYYQIQMEPFDPSVVRSRKLRKKMRRAFYDKSYVVQKKTDLDGKVINKKIEFNQSMYELEFKSKYLDLLLKNDLGALRFLCDSARNLLGEKRYIELKTEFDRELTRRMSL